MWRLRQKYRQEFQIEFHLDKLKYLQEKISTKILHAMVCQKISKTLSCGRNLMKIQKRKLRHKEILVEINLRASKKNRLEVAPQYLQLTLMHHQKIFEIKLYCHPTQLSLALKSFQSSNLIIRLHLKKHQRLNWHWRRLGYQISRKRLK